MLRESIGDLVPGDMRQRIAVEQEQWWTAAALDVVDPGPGPLEVAGCEPLEHRSPLLRSTGSPTTRRPWAAPAAHEAGSVGQARRYSMLHRFSVP